MVLPRASAHPPEHAGEVRVVERDHLGAVAPPSGARQVVPLRSCEVVRGEAQPQVREACVADHVARVACDHEAAGVPLFRGQGQLRQEALRLHQRLVVDHDELTLVRPTVPLQEDPCALVAQQPQLRAACSSPPSSSSRRDRPRSRRCWSRRACWTRRAAERRPCPSGDWFCFGVFLLWLLTLRTGTGPCQNHTGEKAGLVAEIFLKLIRPLF